ncbi:MAG: HD domain-containing protein [Clostridia bacterium]|nr:HD domain-containing protein [Clostridia bacterium]
MITFEDIKNNEKIKAFIKEAYNSLRAIGFTEHGYAHVGLVAERASYILRELGYSERDIELAKIASYMHDIGNIVNRKDHAQSGAIIAFRLLDNMGMEADELAKIVTAIGNHDESTGGAVNPIASALILGDKTDVRRSRVSETDKAKFDVHDRVNYSVIKSDIKFNESKTELALYLDVDTSISSVMDYFEIFLERMVMCKKASQHLGVTFALIVNGQKLA